MIHEFFYSCPVYSFWQCADAEYKSRQVISGCRSRVTFCLTLLLVLLACRIAPRVAGQACDVALAQTKR
jgi:hypothetical protein